MEPEQQLLIFARRLEEMERDFGQMMAQDKGREALAVRIEKMRNFVSAITAPAPPEIRLRVFYGLETLPLTSQLMNFFTVNQECWSQPSPIRQRASSDCVPGTSSSGLAPEK
jgi:hypothetical protein